MIITIIIMIMIVYVCVVVAGVVVVAVGVVATRCIAGGAPIAVLPGALHQQSGLARLAPRLAQLGSVFHS